MDESAALLLSLSLLYTLIAVLAAVNKNLIGVFVVATMAAIVLFFGLIGL